MAAITVFFLGTTSSCFGKHYKLQVLGTTITGSHCGFLGTTTGLLQVWVLQTLIAIIGAINYYHVVFLVSDPPEWQCLEKNVEK